MKKKKYPLTDELKRLYDLLNSLSEAKGIIYKPYGPFWNKKVNTQAVIDIAKEIASTKTTFWREVYVIYPELKEKNISANEKELTENK